MNSIVAPLITAVAGGLFGLLASYFGIQWKIRKDLQAQYDASLRDLRLRVYVELWSLLKPLAAFGPRANLERQQVGEMTEKLRDWYFDSGGLYLSTEAREAYFRLQRGLRTIVSSPRWDQDKVEQIDEESFEHLRRMGSRLRTRLTLDVGTRKPFSMDSGADEDPGWPQRDVSKDEDEGALLNTWWSGARGPTLPP